MLPLLILFCGCLASVAAQTGSFTSFTTSTMEDTSSILPTTVLPTSELLDNTVAILQTAVQSSHELNETTLAPVLNKLYEIVRQLQPDLNFTLTLKNITKV